MRPGIRAEPLRQADAAPTPTPDPTAASALHVGIVMDGNGRWAERRGLPRSAGHAAGAEAVRRVVEAAPGLGVGVLTLYAFSADNWRRPRAEVAALLRLFERYLAAERARCEASGVELGVIGRRDRLPPALLRAIKRAEAATRGGRRLRLRIAIDYSGRDAIRRAAVRLAAGPRSEPTLAELGDLIAAVDNGTPVPPADVVIRTGGESRLSDFLTWESAYAELFFVTAAWPDFSPADLGRVLAEFGRRERRFGGLTASSRG